jgi:hypothetical protein
MFAVDLAMTTDAKNRAPRRPRCVSRISLMLVIKPYFARAVKQKFLKCSSPGTYNQERHAAALATKTKPCPRSPVFSANMFGTG